MLCSTIKASDKSLACNKPSVNSILPPGPDFSYSPDALPLLHLDALPAPALAWGKDLRDGDQHTLGFERRSCSLKGVWAPKDLCRSQVKPAAAQNIH